MSEIFLAITNFNSEFPNIVTWGVVVLLVSVSLVLGKSLIKERIAEWKLNALLKGSGVKSLHNVTIPDGMDGLIFIDHLILMPNEIFLLGEKQYRGLIFAADKISQWTQVVDNKSYKFENPLHQLEANTVYLNSLIKHSMIGKKVLFINGSEFPKGKPDNIISVDELQQWQRKTISEDVKPNIKEDWEILVAAAIKNNMARGKSVLSTDKNKSGGGFFSFLSTTLLVVAWLAWRFHA